jgi:peptidoglycan/xylan/chitin deacetylase (PgdA/CDA1 family)
LVQISPVTSTFFLVANTDPIHTDGYPHPDWRTIDWSVDDIQLLKGVAQRGHEIGAHSMTHRLPELNNDPKLEAEGSKQWIEIRLGLDVPSYCYPFCRVTEPIKNAVINAGYKQARAGATDLSYYSPQNSPDWFGIDCRVITQNEDVGKWVQPGCWHILVFHGIGTLDDGWGADYCGTIRRSDGGTGEAARFPYCGSHYLQRRRRPFAADEGVIGRVGYFQGGYDANPLK